MLKRFIAGFALVFATSTVAVLAQNSNSSTTVRPRTTTSPASTNRSSSEPATPRPTPRSTPRATATPDTPGSDSVVGAFNALLDGIRKADVKIVANVYWNSPRLTLFNNNGSVTKGWEQMRRNRESSYKDVKDVKLTTRDVAITMLGRDGAVVTCLWTQSQTFRGDAETASGRMTLVFRRVGKEWKAIHLHTSPDRPEPARVAPSERASPSPNP
jgi:ketosteroid isomerase-like protein